MKYKDDMIGCDEEDLSEAETLLHRVMKDGVRGGHYPALPKIRERTRRELEKLPPDSIRLDHPKFADA